MPNSTRQVASFIRAISTMNRPTWLKPQAWQLSAPDCLPRPIDSILTRPLSLGARNALCGLMRLKRTMPSASKANLSMRTSMPLARRPSSTVSMLERIGQPTVCSVTPSWARTLICPSAVAPPWLPMAGTMKGRAPRSRTSRAMARTSAGRSASPRLPTVSAMLMPGSTAETHGAPASAS